MVWLGGAAGVPSWDLRGAWVVPEMAKGEAAGWRTLALRYSVIGSIRGRIEAQSLWAAAKSTCADAPAREEDPEGEHVVDQAAHEEL